MTSTTECPNSPGNNCPRYTGEPCPQMCADSWIDEGGCYVRDGDGWKWEWSDRCDEEHRNFLRPLLGLS